VIDDSGEGSEAWEAAQNILKALNFGNLLQQVEQQAQQAQQAAAAENTSVETSPDVPPIKDERAALQSDLILLAAQLAEIAEGGDAG
jgi:hypothetical protein